MDMRAKVAKTLRRYAALSGGNYRKLKAVWNRLPRFGRLKTLRESLNQLRAQTHQPE